MTFPPIGVFVSQVGGYLIALLILMSVDFILGVLTALVKKEFSLEKLAGYLQSDLLPIVGWLALRVILYIPAGYFPAASPVTEAVGYVVYATVFLQILGSVIGTLGKIGVFSSIQNTQTRGQQAMHQYYANYVGQDLADEVFPPEA